MRIGIDYRLLASQANLVNRGIGRYTQQQLREVLRIDGDNEYLLLCPPGSDVSLILPEIRSAPNVGVRAGSASFEPPPGDPYDRRGLLRRAGAYQDWIHGLGIDLYHSTAPFIMEQTAPPAFDACPMVATVYDLIPLIFPSAYLTDDARRSAYAAAARLVRSASRVLAISDATREDAVHYLGFPRLAVDCAYPFADPCFRPLEEREVVRLLGALDGRVGLPDRFVLTIAALHHTKNLELLFAAYARLSPVLRRSLPLVVACHLDANGKAHVRRWAARFGLDEEIVLTGYVSDEELAALYNRATLVVHPSRYEGFGLPVVEAMQCGAAVITTTAASLPEVAGGVAELVDPEDSVGLALAIEALAQDAGRLARMGEEGRERAAVFTPEALARNTLAAYRAALDVEPGGTRRPRAAVVSPVPPAPGEAAAHSAVLLEALSQSFEVEVFTDDDAGPLPDDLLDRYAVHHRSALPRGRFDLVVDNLDRGDPVDGAGLVVVHDRSAATGGNVVVAPLGTVDPCNGRPTLAMLAARQRLGWGAARFVAFVLDGNLPGATVDVVRGGIEETDRLRASDVVVDLAPRLRPSVLVRAAAAGKPLLRAGPSEDLPSPPEFCERVPAPELAARLGALAADPELLARRSAAARTWFERHADLDRTAGFYRTVLALPSRSGAVEGGRQERLGIDRTSNVLCLGLAAVPLAFDLTQSAAEVTLAGRWLEGGGTPLTRALLVNPAIAATGAFDRSRLIVRSADPCRLPFSDETFDAVVSLRAMDAFTPDQVARAVAEAARVVKPGGPVVLSTRVRLHGPAAAGGVTAEQLNSLVARAALEPAGPVPAPTMTSRRRFAQAVAPDSAVDDSPLTVAQGAVFVCHELRLRRTDRHAASSSSS